MPEPTRADRELLASVGLILGEETLDRILTPQEEAAMNERSGRALAVIADARAEERAAEAKKVAAAYAQGVEEGRSCQAILEIQGRDRFLKQFRSEHAEERAAERALVNDVLGVGTGDRKGDCHTWDLASTVKRLLGDGCAGTALADTRAELHKAVRELRGANKLLVHQARNAADLLWRRCPSLMDPAIARAVAAEKAVKRLLGDSE